ncbi:MAG: hypothetical protein ACFFE4_21730 [Candidatus Thorarchaeota archaeon]
MIKTGLILSILGGLLSITLGFSLAAFYPDLASIVQKELDEKLYPN